MRVRRAVVLLLVTTHAWADPPPDATTQALTTLVADCREAASLAHLARTRSGRSLVRAYAARVERDARQVERAVGEHRGSIPPDDGDAARALDEVPGSAFDASFLAAMRARHDRAVALATGALAESRPSAERDLLARLLPLIRQDARLARLVEASS